MVARALFFFSSRRRHTRSDRDWSSDVCSSDLLRKTYEARSMSQIDVSRIYGEARRRSVVVWCLGAIWAIVTLGVGLFSVFAVIQYQNTTKEINDLKTKADNVLRRLEEMNNTVTKLGDIEQRSSFIVALNIQ